MNYPGNMVKVIFADWDTPQIDLDTNLKHKYGSILNFKNKRNPYRLPDRLTIIRKQTGQLKIQRSICFNTFQDCALCCIIY